MNKINVAIADDNQRTVEMMTELLEQESDIEVIASADDGEEALRIIKEKQPDVILLDIIMPKLDGIGVLERLQTEDLSKRPIIIMVSAMGQEKHSSVLWVRRSIHCKQWAQFLCSSERRIPVSTCPTVRGLIPSPREFGMYLIQG